MKSKAKSMLYKIIRRSFNSVGFDVVRKEDLNQTNPRRWKERLRQAKELGFAPKTILDGGAFKGLWSKEVARLFLGAQIILVEPNPFILETIKSNISDILPSPVIVNIALGECQKKAPFNFWQAADSDYGASLLDYVSRPANQVIQVDVDTLDNISQRLSFTPDLIKLDLQGGELAALKGATMVLKHAELAIIEFGCLDAYINRTTPRELIDIMYDHDFCLYDIVSLIDRPYDGALGGGDFFFIKRSSKLRSHIGWE
jgi:FkbM family methyltransferase